MVVMVLEAWYFFCYPTMRLSVSNREFQILRALREDHRARPYELGRRMRDVSSKVLLMTLRRMKKKKLVTDGWIDELRYDWLSTRKVRYWQASPLGLELLRVMEEVAA